MGSGEAGKWVSPVASRDSPQNVAQFVETLERIVPASDTTL